MPAPVDNLTVANLDAGTDRLDLARVEILNAINKIKEIIANQPVYSDGSTGNITVVSSTPPATGRNYPTIHLGGWTSIYGYNGDTLGNVSAVSMGVNVNRSDFPDTPTYRTAGSAVNFFMQSNESGAPIVELGVFPSGTAGAALPTVPPTRLEMSLTGLELYGTTVRANGSTIWHQGNDGAGSGLDADLLDGLSPTVAGTANSLPLRNSLGGLEGVTFGSLTASDILIYSAVASVDGSYGTRFQNGGITAVMFYNAVGRSLGSAAACSFSVASPASTGRSINAGGTINASGADYAEYERKSDTCENIVKGQIIGFDSKGRLTDKWSEAISFGVKSTSPSYVGGDTWGGEEALGARPEAPKEPEKPAIKLKDKELMNAEINHVRASNIMDRLLNAATKQQRAIDENSDEDKLESLHETMGYLNAELFKAKENLQSCIENFEKEKARAQRALDQIETEYACACDHYQVRLTQYEIDKKLFDDKLETERQKVDRIAYSGKVPCNVYGAQSGDYIIPIKSGQDGISGKAVKNPTFVEYRTAVGQVRKILDDGRAEISVKMGG